VGIHASTFKDFLLKPELLRAVVDNGFEHPSEVQQECIPQAILGMDVICQVQCEIFNINYIFLFILLSKKNQFSLSHVFCSGKSWYG
jgi:hypothetical protein